MRELRYEAADKQVSTPACHNRKGLYRGLHGVQSRTLSRWSQHHLALPRLCPWNSSHCGSGRRGGGHSKDQGGGEGARLPRSSSGVKGQSCPLNDLSNKRGSTCPPRPCSPGGWSPPALSQPLPLEHTLLPSQSRSVSG